MLQKSGILFDEVYTSLLRRSIRTANLVLMEMGQEYIPVHKHWRLNERSYGDLVGKNKKQIVELHGKDQVKRWRRSYDEPPPDMSDDHPYHPARDPRYRLVRSTNRPNATIPIDFIITHVNTNCSPRPMILDVGPNSKIRVTEMHNGTLPHLLGRNHCPRPSSW